MQSQDNREIGNCPPDTLIQNAACDALKNEAKLPKDKKTPIPADCKQPCTCCDKKDYKGTDRQQQIVHQEFCWTFVKGKIPCPDPKKPDCKVDVQITATADVSGWKGTCCPPEKKK